ncbi:MAG TPA: SusC/RagA family TonB-linked outer membrane protein, partial [Ohtaekwangia sp.]|nr:SusC/RagA family TonB-linked outer membrane protein [Ohtaekwangia sp.]
QMAGVNITTASGSPGGALNIRIRGLSTNGDNNPLILVDGIPYSHDGLNALNPSDIESVDILKDATAAIYGVAAANGIIFITTKQGRKNAKPTLEFSGYYGVQETAKKLDLLTAREFAVLKNEAFAAGGQTPPYANVNLGKGTDWQDEVFESAPIQNYSLSMTGGSEKSTYSIGGSFLDQKGIVGGDKASYKRYNGRLNFTTELAPKVTLQNVLLFTHEKRSTVPEDGIAAVLYNAINASPAASVRTPEGRYTYLEEFSDIINPLAQIENTYNEALVNKLVGKLELVYKINDNFDITGRAGYNYAIVDDKVFSPLVYYGSGKAQNTAANANLDPFTAELAEGLIVPVHNRVTETRTTYGNYIFDAFINYDKAFGEHKVKGTLGTSVRSEDNRSLSGTGFNIPYNDFDFADISLSDAANLQNSTSSWQDINRILSYFIRGQYTYRDRYMVSAMIRRDGSTNFGKNNRFGYFPAVSAGWVVTSEPFFESDLIQFMKVRVSHGVIGNDRIARWRYRGLLNGEAVYPFDDQLVTGIGIGALGNQDLKWEETQQTDFGVDLNLFNDRISFTADYYIKTTKDLLFQPDISGIAGAYGAGGMPPLINAGTVRNQGFEFILGYDQQIGRDFSFHVKYNLTTVKNKVIELPRGVDFLEGGAFGVGGGNATRMEVGRPLGYFFGYKTEGVYQNQTEITERGVTQDGARPGDLRFADVDNSGGINFSNDSDKTMIGSPIPDVTMGLSLGINYKGIDFSALFYASIGNEILRNYERQQPLANMLDYRINRWTGEGSTNEHPRLSTAANRNGVISDYFVEDGSYLRIKNIQLGYSLPTAISERIGAAKIRVYVAANNLLTLTRYQGFDPDFSSPNALASGIDYGFYPQARIYMAGLNLTF